MPRYFEPPNGLKQISTRNIVHLTNLKTGTVYLYRIFAKEVLNKNERHIRYGDMAATGVFRKAPLEFMTNDPSKSMFSLLMLNDIHKRNGVMKTLLNNGNFKADDLILLVTAEGKTPALSVQNLQYFKKPKAGAIFLLWKSEYGRDHNDKSFDLPCSFGNKVPSSCADWRYSKALSAAAH